MWIINKLKTYCGIKLIIDINVVIEWIVSCTQPLCNKSFKKSKKFLRRLFPLYSVHFVGWLEKRDLQNATKQFIYSDNNSKNGIWKKH